ncbi:MAG: ATP-binding protein, partial [Anaerolineales bacterium]|nr:ATP-binding protein [Anaerolineales bacterium]
VRIEGLSRFWDDEKPAEFWQNVADFILSAHGTGNYMTFVLTGSANRIELYLAAHEPKLTHSLLASAYPGIRLRRNTISNLGTKLKARFKHSGVLSGIPSFKVLPKQLDQLPSRQLERVIHGMKGASWAYAVQLYPRQFSDYATERAQILQKLTVYASLSRRQHQESTQVNSSISDYVSEASSAVSSSEYINKQADYVIKMLEDELVRLDDARAMGRWQAAVCFGASTGLDLQRLGTLLGGVLGGAESRPEPVRVHFARPGASTKLYDFHTNLHTGEIAGLLHLPREEFPGYGLQDHVEFDVEFTAQGEGLAVGAIQWAEQGTGTSFEISIDDLTRHGVVFGVTGSGKTTTILALLTQLQEDGRSVPFLVLEPAKTEYRALLGKIKGKTALGILPQLRVYTLGNDTVAPFRLNPFEFDLPSNYEAAPVLSHIDLLKSVFNAAFILYAPMPYVLDIALHELYQDRGWDLATGLNMRLTPSTWSQRDSFVIFPTLTDLYHKVQQVTSRLGYEARIEQDVTAGLQARIGALRLGAKGLMLDTPRGLPLAELLSRPTVLELESVGSDDEKTFLMGLLLARLYSHRQLQVREGVLRQGLQHVLVVEEAHRLLKAVNTQVDSESANLRAQAIESFVNMLSEVRHYGQAVLVAEQIPAKLTPDVIKNSNLKIIHRLTAQDDRELVGTSMNMTNEQVRHIAVLSPGEAIAYAAGCERPYRLKVPNFKDSSRLSMPLDKAIASRATDYIELAHCLAVPDFTGYSIRAGVLGAPDSLVWQAALQQIGRPESDLLWAKMVLRTIFARKQLPEVFDELRRWLSTSPYPVPKIKQNELLLVTLVLGAEHLLRQRGADRHWPFELSESLRQSLTEGWIALARTNSLELAAPALDRFLRAYEDALRLDGGPYASCKACRECCLYRSEVSRLAGATHRSDLFAILRNYADEEARYEAVGNSLKRFVRQWLGMDSSEVVNVGYCLALELIAGAAALDEYEKREFGREVARQLLT